MVFRCYPRASSCLLPGRLTSPVSVTSVGANYASGTARERTIQRLAALIYSRGVCARSFHVSPGQSRKDPPSLRTKTKQNDIFAKVFTWRSVALLAVCGGFLVYYAESIKREKEEDLAKKDTKSYGQAALGGDWELTRLDGTKGGSEDLRGNFALIYFGFTFCPDICPEEIEKAIQVVDAIDDDAELTRKLIPVFVTIDPERDTPAVVKNYIEEFSPKIVGYVGTLEEIRKASRCFRVYYSKGQVDEDGDYIVDHSIIMYLVGPDGIFMQYYGQSKSATEMIDDIRRKMLKWDLGEVKEKKNKRFWGLLG